ncbi:hypothetical protein AWB69_09241 [Caballeronia udeis]|uniref:Uncharacterized protein n=1 Tax=Caballeronia udeis TaxID=1232866 RepID=A0A158K2T8_9BURK|nr:hypothetical protein AWB69_09241 [Caballeronia udeis]
MLSVNTDVPVAAPRLLSDSVMFALSAEPFTTTPWLLAVNVPRLMLSVPVSVRLVRFESLTPPAKVMPPVPVLVPLMVSEAALSVNALVTNRPPVPFTVRFVNDESLRLPMVTTPAAATPLSLMVAVTLPMPSRAWLASPSVRPPMPKAPLVVAEPSVSARLSVVPAVSVVKKETVPA